jgi:chromosome segregation ATPase
MTQQLGHSKLGARIARKSKVATPPPSVINLQRDPRARTITTQVPSSVEQQQQQPSVPIHWTGVMAQLQACIDSLQVQKNHLHLQMENLQLQMDSKQTHIDTLQLSIANSQTQIESMMRNIAVLRRQYFDVSGEHLVTVSDVQTINNTPQLLDVLNSLKKIL